MIVSSPNSNTLLTTDEKLNKAFDKARRYLELRAKGLDTGTPDDPWDALHVAAAVFTGILIGLDIVTSVAVLRKPKTFRKTLDLAYRWIGAAIATFNLWPEIEGALMKPFAEKLLNEFIGVEGRDIDQIENLEQYAVDTYFKFITYALTFAAYGAIPVQLGLIVHPAIGAGLQGYVDALYWGLGICYLTWMATGPWLQAAVANPIRYYANMKFRTRILSPSQWVRAYVEGLIDERDLIRYLQMHGYSSKSIEVLVKEARIRREERVIRDNMRLLRLARQMYQPMPPSTLANALAAGIVDETEAKLELALQGRATIEQSDIAKIVEKARESPEALKKAPWIEWIKFVAEARKHTTIARYKLAQKWSGTVLQLADAVARGIVDEPTATQWLIESGFTEPYIRWFKARVEDYRRRYIAGRRRPRRLSIAWLTRLYRAGIVNLDFIRSYLINKLGYEPEDAELIVRYIEYRYGRGG